MPHSVDNLTNHGISIICLVGVIVFLSFKHGTCTAPNSEQSCQVSVSLNYSVSCFVITGFAIIQWFQTVGLAQGHREFPFRKLKIPPTITQNSQKFLLIQ